MSTYGHLIFLFSLLKFSHLCAHMLNEIPYIQQECAIVHFSTCPFYLKGVYLDFSW